MNKHEIRRQIRKRPPGGNESGLGWVGGRVRRRAGPGRAGRLSGELTLTGLLLLLFIGAGSSGRQPTSPLSPHSEAAAIELPLDGPGPELCYTGTLFYWNLVSAELAAEVPVTAGRKCNGMLPVRNHGRGRWRLTCECGENAEKFTKEEEEDENGSSIGAGR